MLRVYDEFLEDDTICGLRDRAYRLHVSSLIYCSKNLTDGVMSERAVKVVQAILGFQVKRHVLELVAAQLWIADDEGGYQIRNYLEFNPPSSTVKKERAASRQRMRKLRDKRAGDTDVTPERSAEQTGEHAGEGSHAVPNQSSPDLSEEPDSTTGLPSYEAMESLPFENEFLTLRLLELVKRDADEGTETVLRAYAAKVAPAAISRVIENVTKPSVRNRASYAVRSLKAEATEAEAA